jgi:hypothetical protein
VVWAVLGCTRFLLNVRQQRLSRNYKVRCSFLRQSSRAPQEGRSCGHVQSTLAEEAFMIRPIRSASQISLALVTVLLTLCAGCGSSSHSSQHLSPEQAQAVSQEVDAALQSALAVALSSGLPADKHRSLAAIIGHPSPNQSSDCTTNPNGETCDIPVSYSGACPGGGTIGVSGEFDFTLNNSGDGSDSSTLTIKPSNCTVSNLTINGDPSITVGTQMNIANDVPVYPITLTENGGISYGPDPSGKCTMNVTLTINSATSCKISGNICGQSLSGTC